MTIHVFSDRFPYTFFDFVWLPRDFVAFCLIPRFGGFQSFCFHVCGLFFEGGGFKYNTNGPIGKLHEDHFQGLAQLFQEIFSVQSVCGRLFNCGERSLQNVCQRFNLWRALHRYFYTEFQFQRSDLLQRPVSIGQLCDHMQRGLREKLLVPLLERNSYSSSGIHTGKNTAKLCTCRDHRICC